MRRIVGNDAQAGQRQVAPVSEAGGDLAFHVHREGAGDLMRRDLVSAFPMIRSLPNNCP